MNRTRSRAQQIKQRVEAICTAALIVAITALALCASISAAFSDDGGAPRPTVTSTVERHDPVTDYNDGWVDAKADDCEQGFKPACKWLRDNAK